MRGSGFVASCFHAESGSVATFAEQSPILTGDNAAAALAVSVVPSDLRLEAAANGLPARPAHGASAPSEVVFELLGQRTRGRSTAAVARSSLRSAAIDAAVTDSLLSVHHIRTGTVYADDSPRTAHEPRQKTDTRRERTRDLDEKCQSVVRKSTEFAHFLI